MISIAIPAFNEGKNIKKTATDLIEEFSHANIPLELVLVDNGSRDNTALILKDLALRYDLIKAVKIDVNEGYGWGIINGLKLCTGSYVGYMGADGQITPKDAVSVSRKLLSGDFDLCKVRRTIRNDGPFRIFLSKSFNMMFSFLFGISTDDVNGSPKIMRRSCYKKMKLESKDWFIDAEIMIKAARNGMRIGEVDVEFKERRAGKSNVSPATVIEFLKNLLKYKLRLGND